MNFIAFACVLAVASARPDSYGAAPAPNAAAPAEVIPILRDDRVAPEGGSYSFDFEAGNGITVSESGAPLDIEGNPTGQQGSVSFTFPSGEKFELKFVANENGYQPESAHLPVAPAFPHPIPDFVKEQIEKAAREDAEAAKAGPAAPAPAPAAPSGQYGYSGK